MALLKWQEKELLCPWDSPGKNNGVGSHPLLQGIFLTQGLCPGLQDCRQILYHLSHWWSPPAEGSFLAKSCLLKYLGEELLGHIGNSVLTEVLPEYHFAFPTTVCCFLFIDSRRTRGCFWPGRGSWGPKSHQRSDWRENWPGESLPWGESCVLGSAPGGTPGSRTASVKPRESSLGMLGSIVRGMSSSALRALSEAISH